MKYLKAKEVYQIELSLYTDMGGDDFWDYDNFNKNYYKEISNKIGHLSWSDFYKIIKKYNLEGTFESDEFDKKSYNVLKNEYEKRKYNHKFMKKLNE